MTDGSKALVPLQERRVHFYGDQILAVLVEEDGESRVYIPLRPIADRLKLAWSSQLQRIKRDPDLAEGLRDIELMRESAGQRYEQSCLRLEYLPGFLFGITTSKVRADLQEQVRRYKRECHRVLWEAFQRGELFTSVGDLLPPPATTIVVNAESAKPLPGEILTDIQSTLHAHDQASRDGQARIEAQLNHAVELISTFFSDQVARIDHIDERTQRLTPAHAQQIQDAVDLLAKLWRKRSPHLTEQQAKAWAYHSIHQRFQAPSYKEIADDRFEELRSYLQKAIRRAGDGQEPEQGQLF